jgi:hypothetical protein
MNDDDFRADLDKYAKKDPEGEKMDYGKVADPEFIHVLPYEMADIDDDIETLVSDYVRLHPDEALFVERHQNLKSILHELRRDNWLSLSMSNVVNAKLPEDSTRAELAGLIHTAIDNVRTDDVELEEEKEIYRPEFTNIITEILITSMIG